MPTPRATESLGVELARLAAADLYRQRRIAAWTPELGPVRLVVDGRPCLAFCSNDYLGLSRDPRIARAMAAGALAWGAGSGAAHLVTGHTAEHHALEDELA